MITMPELFKWFGEAATPIKYQERIRMYFIKSGFTDLPLKFIGGLFLFNIFFSIFFYLFVIFKLVPNIFLSISSLVALFLLLGILEYFMIYFYLDLRIFKRVKDIEEQLDKFLQQVSDNLKGGMTFDKALWNSAKIEFGALSTEIRMVAKNATTGKDIDGALRKFMGKYDSPTIRRTFSLISEGIRGGGKITNIIDRIVLDLKETKRLDKEMKTAVLNYVIFISVIVMIVAPGLFAVAGQLLIVLSKFVENLASSLSSSATIIPLKISEVSISLKDFRIFSISALSVTSIFSAMIVAIITKGKIRAGLRYIPLFWIVSILCYLIGSRIMAAAFSAF